MSGDAKTNEARIVAELSQFRDELSDLVGRTGRDGDLSTGRERLKRLKIRLVSYLRDHVSEEEAGRFEKAKPTKIQSGALPGAAFKNLANECESYAAFLQALSEEIERNPDLVLQARLAPESELSDEPMQYDKLLISKRHKAQIGKAISGLGFRIQEFYWDEMESIEKHGLIVSVLKHVEGYYYTFDFYGPQGLLSERSPGINAIREQNSFMKFDDQFSWLVDWLALVKQELLADDPWENLYEQAALITSVGEIEIENTRFEEKEIGLIADALSQISDQIQAVESLSKEQKMLFEGSIERLEESSKRFGRKDWIFFAYSTLAFMCGFLTDDLKIQIFHSFRELVSHLLNLPHLLK